MVSVSSLLLGFVLGAATSAAAYPLHFAWRSASQSPAVSSPRSISESASWSIQPAGPEDDQADDQRDTNDRAGRVCGGLAPSDRLAPRQRRAVPWQLADSPVIQPQFSQLNERGPPQAGTRTAFPPAGSVRPISSWPQHRSLAVLLAAFRRSAKPQLVHLYERDPA